MIREFHLSPAGEGGVSCDADGAFVGAIPILNRLRKDGKDEWHPRDCEELSNQMSAHYGLPIDMSSKRGGLKAIASALNEDEVARAQIATVLLGIPNPPQLSKGVCSREQMIKFVRDLHWSGMIKWDPDEHPRWPAGSMEGKGGQFAPKGEGGETGTAVTSHSDAIDRTRPNNPDNGREERAQQANGNGRAEQDTSTRNARIQLADNAMSDAVDDPVAEAATRAAAAARHDAGVSHSQARPTDSGHENFWQTLGAHLSHEVKSALWQIGQAEVVQSYNNFAVANDEANGIARVVRSYAEYRAQPWLGTDGRPTQVPAVNTGYPVADLGALTAHLQSQPNKPFTRPATNADWIDPLINLASLSAMAAGPAFRLAGPAAEALDTADASAISANAAERAKGSFSISDWSGYPPGLPRPTGPFRLLNGDEYDAARAAANSANRALREADPVAFAGKEIHEIHPVKFGGSPIDPANKIALTPGQHSSATTWWARLKRGLQK